jgi:lipoprotein signal peptidase
LTRISRSTRVFLWTTAAVLLCDLVSKEMALVLLADTAASPYTGGGMGFTLLLNSGAAGGVQLGDYTRFINVASMLAVAALVVVVVRQLSLVHRLAPVALGLIAGAAIGNTVSLLMRSAVVDFIVLGGGSMVVNLADLAAVAGVAGLVPVALGIAVRIREGYTDAVVPATAPVEMPQLVYDREVPIALASEVAVEPEVLRRREQAVTDRAPQRDATDEFRA